MADVAAIFRVTLQVASLKKGAAFYAKLLRDAGRPVHATRHYFDCGPVILMLVDPTPGGAKARPAPDVLYFGVADLGPFHARAKRLRCLMKGEFHGAPAGAIVERPWGERSFYAVDPFGNELCFVEKGSEHTARAAIGRRPAKTRRA